MKKTNEKQVTVIEEEYTCDVCKKPCGSHIHKCECCKKDICRDCTELDYSKSDDYPDRYCDSCWTIGEPFRKQIKEMEEQSYSEQEKLKEEWFRKVKETNEKQIK